MQTKQYGIFSLPVIVGALGFFVDIYDLLLFNIVRRASFRDLGVAESAMQSYGESILNWQMIGLTIGGILWGILGDKKGRKNVLFGSILLYSVATIANGFVQDVDQYTWLRFIAGLGLAGELGASITLTSELLPKEKRGLGATIIATSGVFGTITAYTIYSLSGEDWRLCYFIGGGMGLALLFLRENLKRRIIRGRNPLTRFGMEIAAVARRFVPNCSALIVIYRTDIPEPKPSPIQSRYMLKLLPPPRRVKNKVMNTANIP